jgi:hypothetical protein
MPENRIEIVPRQPGPYGVYRHLANPPPMQVIVISSSSESESVHVSRLSDDASSVRMNGFLNQPVLTNENESNELSDLNEPYFETPPDTSNLFSDIVESNEQDD